MRRSTRTSDAPSVAVAIVTFRRPEQLDRAIRGVIGQLSDLSIDSHLIVVDNDPDGSARAVVANAASPSVRYVAEPRIGIAAARNAAIDAAHDYRLLAFIDDDETPSPGWLQALVDGWSTWRCDAVAGPNRRVLDGSEDPWVAASGFFDPIERPDGSVIRGAPTSNLLLDLATTRRLGLRFDDRFGTTGGSDTLFTRQLTAGGGVIRWCQHAVTTEPVPPERASREWIIARDRRVSNAWSHVHLVLADSPTTTCFTVVWLVATAVKLLVVGSVRVAVGVLNTDLRQRSRGERALARARGLLVGLLGTRVEEYQRDRPPDPQRPLGSGSW